MPEVKPEIVHIYDLIRRVESGQICVPSFQRLFVWKRENMVDLLDSIRKQYPIGSLLLWVTDLPVQGREWIGPVHVSRKGARTIAHILDGQQRLSTLVGTLRMPQEADPPLNTEDDPGRWRIHFNAKTEEFEYLREGPNPEIPGGHHFPLWKLMDTYAFLKEGQRMVDEAGEKNGQLYVRRVQELARTFQSYKLPVISIEHTELSQAVAIFSRLNAKGRAITTDEMVSALTYSTDPSGQSDFHLASQIDALIEEIGSYNFGGVDRTVVLRALLATMGEDIYRTDWTRIADTQKKDMKDRFKSVTEKTGKALVNAIQFLNTLGVHTDRLLPYAMQLVVLSAFFFACANPTPAQRAFLSRWFWVSSFTGWFGSGNPSRVAAMVREFKEQIATTPDPQILESMELLVPAQSFSNTFDTRSARTRTLILVLLAQRPRDPDGNEMVDVWRWIAERGPGAFGYVFADVSDATLKSSPANRILRMPGKGNFQGKTWLEGLSTLHEEQRNAVLLSHGIPADAFPDLLADRREAFLQKRMNHMVQLERDVMDRERVVLPPGNGP
ncbi:MAG: DUF262 domain-containing protein [Magnetococcus sp. YQC-5]